MNLQNFEALKIKSGHMRSEDYAQRIVRLKQIKTWIEKNQTEIEAALFSDFSKPRFETFLSETYPVISEIKFFIANLKSLMKVKKVKTPIALFGHKSRIRFENKGVVLIISPWNYPFQLALIPLVTALAAGNTIVIKPSEFTPSTSRLLEKLVADCFTSVEVLVETGDKHKTAELLTYKFDHVFFTGSTAVGRIIAKSCADRLIPYTLELGGKSPTIIDESADLQVAADKIFWGKFFNLGQSCVAPDYVLIQESVADDFLSRLNLLNESNATSERADFVSDHYRNRIQNFVIDKDFKKQPLAILELKDSSHPIMKEEIFGPILPVIRYSKTEDLDRIINTSENPLSLYVFSKNLNHIDSLLLRFKSGNVAVNSVMVQFGNHHLPFGGINESGHGRYHGKAGFLELSNQRAVIEHRFFHFTTRLTHPPYTNLKYKLLRLLKYL